MMWILSLFLWIYLWFNEFSPYSYVFVCNVICPFLLKKLIKKIITKNLCQKQKEHGSILILNTEAQGNRHLEPGLIPSVS